MITHRSGWEEDVNQRLKYSGVVLNLVCTCVSIRLNADADCNSYARNAWQSFQTGNPRIVFKPLQTPDAQKDKSKNKGNRHA
jgi:hypothetical protein